MHFVLDAIDRAQATSVLLDAEPLGKVVLDLDTTPPDRVHEDGAVRVWRLDLPLSRGPDGRLVEPLLTAGGQPLPAAATVELLPTRSEVLFKDHPDFKDIRRAGDVHGNRYLVFDEPGEITFKVPLPDWPCRLALSTKVLGTKDDFTATDLPPTYDVLIAGKLAGTITGSWKLGEQLFDLPNVAGEVAVTVRMDDVTAQKGGMPMLRAFAVLAADGCDRLLLRGGAALRGLRAEYAHAAPPAVTPLFTESLAQGEQREWSGDVVVLPGTVAVVAGSGQEWELLVDGSPVGRARGRGQEEVSFRCSRLGRARLTLRSNVPLKGSWQLVQPRAIFCKLRDPMESLRDPSPFVRGLEAAGGHPLVRHVMSKDDTRLALLAPVPTVVEFPVELRAGDRFEVEIAALPLVDEHLRHPPVKGRVTFVRAGAPPVALAEIELSRKRRLDWARTSRPITAAEAGSGTLRFESACVGTPAVAAFEALLAFADPVIVRPATRRQPNVLVYLIDTLRADHCTPYGYARDTTPQLQRLAAEGVVFERAFSQAPWTRPSVATLFSSYLHSFHNASKTTGLAPEIETLAERFRKAGYATGAFLANAHVHGASLNFEQGFSQFEAVEKARQRGDSRANQVHEEAFAWLDQQQDRPFFLYLHTIDPHAPYDPPASTRGTWSGDYSGRMSPARTNARELTSRAPLAPADLQHVIDLYDEEILFNDREFGVLCDQLRERGLWDDTIVLVVSDHGEEFYEHEGFGHGSTLWNELVHVPLILKPDRRAGETLGGGRVREPVRVMDVPQTLLLRAGLAAPEAEFMGVDLSPGMFGLELPELPVIAEEYPDKKMLISGPLKLIWYGPGCRKQRTWLFNLAEDPRELVDLSESRADAARAMKGELERILKDYEERGFVRYKMVQEKLGAADLEALAQLGYIGDGAEEDEEAGDDGEAGAEDDADASAGDAEEPAAAGTEPRSGAGKGRRRQRRDEGADDGDAGSGGD
ncbi:MAG: sulfatase [Planctomycetes bacterium]|nr:sulfatase [Planctomycetota bacterium]